MRRPDYPKNASQWRFTHAKVDVDTMCMDISLSVANDVRMLIVTIQTAWDRRLIDDLLLDGDVRHIVAYKVLWYSSMCASRLVDVPAG